MTDRGAKKISRRIHFSRKRRVSWLRRLVAGFSLQSSGFGSKQFRVGFVVNETHWNRLSSEDVGFPLHYQ
jgi:hypothetical protein